jgi:ATP synthase protein I
MPLFLVSFILLGFAAGIKTMMRSAKEVQENVTAFRAEKEEE